MQWNRASWEAAPAHKAAILGRERRRKVVLQDIRVFNEFIFLHEREIVVSVVTARIIDRACGVPAEADQKMHDMSVA